MQIIKYIMLFFVFAASSLIGNYLAQRYTFRLEELQELKNALNMFKSKIKFSYEPIPEIFEEISKVTRKNTGKIFIQAKEKMKTMPASTAWEEAVEKSESNLKQEDKRAIKSLAKLLGITDTEGQISQIEVTESFLNKQIKEAEEEKHKNEKLYRKLGTILGLVLVIILV